MFGRGSLQKGGDDQIFETYCSDFIHLCSTGDFNFSNSH